MRTIRKENQDIPCADSATKIQDGGGETGPLNVSKSERYVIPAKVGNLPVGFKFTFARENHVDTTHARTHARR